MFHNSIKIQVGLKRCVKTRSWLSISINYNVNEHNIYIIYTPLYPKTAKTTEHLNLLC